jgi:hypothetical protein
MVSKSRTPQNLSKQKSHPKESKTSGSRMVIGKIYSDNCGHCTVMKPEWKKMKENIKNKCSKYNIPEPECLDVEINTNLDELDEFNNNNQEFLQQTKIEYEYVPTIFVIHEDGIKYYEGERSCDKMESFMLDRYYKHHGIPVSIGGKKSKNTKTKKAKSKNTKTNKAKSKKTKKNFFAIFGF